MLRSSLKRLAASPRLAQWAGGRASGRGLVVMYHDIGPDGGPGSWLRVPQSAFDQQLAALSRIGRIVGPDEFFSFAEDYKPGLRLLVTFDDGYVGNHRFGLPVLQSHRAPALFFVSTWHAETGEPFWFDRVVDAVQAGLVTEVDLSDLGLRPYRFHGQDGPRRWNDIQELLVDIKALGNPGEPDVDRILQRLGELGGEPGASLLREHRPLTWVEMRQMAATGLCHFGTHGHRHEILTCLDTVALGSGLARSRSLLEEHVGSPVRHLAYPNGDVDERVRAACRACGVERGYLITPGLVRRDTDPLAVPRIGIGGYDGLDILHYQINRSLLAARRK